MRLSEIITIYLAVGAPFGVASYLRKDARVGRFQRAFAEAVAAALLWPLPAAAILFKRLRHIDGRRATEELYARIAEAERALLLSVNRILLMTPQQGSLTEEKRAQTLYALRESVGQYVCLAVADTDERAEPARHEMELARLCGLRGEELRVAGRCAHRRNLSRVHARFEHERSRLLSKLPELSAEADDSSSAYLDERARAERRPLSEARLEFYRRAVALFSLLNDVQAAGCAARSLERECYRLRSLRESDQKRKPASNLGEEPCTEQSAQLIYKGLQRETTFTQG